MSTERPTVSRQPALLHRHRQSLEPHRGRRFIRRLSKSVRLKPESAVWGSGKRRDPVLISRPRPRRDPVLISRLKGCRGRGLRRSSASLVVVLIPEARSRIDLLPCPRRDPVLISRLEGDEDDEDCESRSSSSSRLTIMIASSLRLFDSSLHTPMDERNLAKHSPAGVYYCGSTNRRLPGSRRSEHWKGSQESSCLARAPG